MKYSIIYGGQVMKKTTINLFMCFTLFLLIIFTLNGCAGNNENNISKKMFETFHKNNISANIGANILKLDDSLYFYTFNENLDTEVYEYKSGQPKIIYSEPKPSAFDDNTRFSFYHILNGKILRTANSDTYFDTETGRMIESSKNYSPDNKKYMSFINNNQRYFSDLQSLYKYDDGEYKQLLTNKVLNIDYLPLDSGFYYLEEPYFYYQKNVDGKVFICRYDINKKDIVNEIEVLDTKDKYESVLNIIADNNYVYFVFENILYQVNLKSKNIEKLFETDGRIIANYCENKLFIGVSSSKSQNGLYIIDLEQDKKTEKIYDREVNGVYLFDKEYVYIDSYSDDDNYFIYRIAMEEEKIEKIFDYLSSQQ